MAEGGEEDIGPVVECLVNMFGGVLNRDAIVTVVESCGGDLNLSVDAVMNITNDGCATQPDAENNAVSINATPARDVEGPQKTVQNTPGSEPVGQTNHPNPGNVQPERNLPSNSYSGAIQTASKPAGNPPSDLPSGSKSYGAVPKARTQENRPTWNDQIRRIIEVHNQGGRILILMRGAPGSGKTHLAQQIIEMMIGATASTFKTHICSTDDFFMFRGRYLFNKSNLSEAHSWNQNRAKVAMFQGLSPIIIDNTNIEVWEMEFYVRVGVETGYIIEVVEPNTTWAWKPNQLAKRNLHNVPIHSIKRMIDNYFPFVTGEWLLKYFKLKYPPGKNPPVLRSMPVFQPLDEHAQIANNDASTNTSGNQQPAKSADMTAKEIAVTLKDEVTCTEQDLASAVISSSPEDNLEVIENPILNKEEVDHENESENNSNQNLELQKQLDEIEKVEQAWEEGERWDELQAEAATAKSSNNDNEKNPKPQRDSNNKPSSDPDENLINVVNNCQDWRQISLFMPPWKDDNQDNQTANPEGTVVLVDTRCSSTCMELGDFDLNKTTHKIIPAAPRNINEFHISFQREKIPEKRMLDKSTTTYELSLTNACKRCKNEESHFSAFRKLFKNVSKTALRDIFDKCMGDVNWAVEIVLDGVAANQFDTVDEEVSEEEDVGDHELCTCLSSYNILPDTSPTPEVVPEPDNATASTSNATALVPKKNNKRDVKTSDASLQLKRQIEQNVFIAENHYSKHCLKLRKWRHGEYPTDEEKPSDENQPSTSQNLQSNQGFDCGNESDEINSDDEESIASMEVLEKTVNINLGREFIAELDALFGRTDMTYPENLMPKINIPLSLLNEINALWMESLMHQLDEHERQAAKMVQEDEEFARVVAAKEAELQAAGKPPEVLDFKEIMDMDYALTLYQRDVAEWKNKEPNDLAAKLTRDKLYNLFPDVSKEVLAELLMAHDNNFQSTVEVLLVSTGNAHLLQEKNGINNFVTQKEMERQRKILEEEKKALSEVEWPLLPAGEVPDMEAVNTYRNTADRHLKSRNLNIQKACDYVHRGMLTVGGYYRQLAEFHKLKYEQSNSLAAASLMQIHAAKCPDSATIDLHYLRVGEAKESLDLFIDTHIQKLKSMQGHGPRHHTLYFITGRGLHSNGRPRVKPAVKKRLRERGLNCSEVNPGLLSAKVCADDKLTHQLA